MDERRRFPRLETVLPIKLSDDEFDVLTETKNISANGAYFPVDKPLALMTKFNVVILIPLQKNKQKTIRKINCCGIVVRNQKANNNEKYPYRTGIYFTEMNEQDKKILRSHIDSCLNK